MSQSIEAFVEKWAASGAAERANKDMFLAELCDALDVPRPNPTTGDSEKDTYVFEKDAVLSHEGGGVTLGKMDLFKVDCLVLEAKQGSEAGAKKLGTAKRETPAWNVAMKDAYGQALKYARTLDKRVPFLVACGAAEERAGLVRWLRPDFQKPEKAHPMAQVSLAGTADDDDEPATPAPAATVLAWPKKLPDQISAVRELVTKTPDEWSTDQVASAFKGARKPDVEELLDTLSALGLLVNYELDEGRRWRAAKFVERSSNRPPP